MNKKPQKSLIKSLRKRGGRNKAGRITIRHRGGGAKRRYRIIDFAQKDMGKMQVLSIEYDPNRTCKIALIEKENRKRYILAPHGLKEGDEIEFAEKSVIKLGNRMRLKNVPVGSIVHNIELVPGNGGKIARSAGNSCQIMAHEGKHTLLKMPSTETRKVRTDCFCSIGNISNPEHRFNKIGKAGGNRLRGKRPTVRGSAMNPVDHPHGGGEGRSSIGMKYPKTPWGKHAFGVKTRTKKKYSDRLIVKRRKK